MYDTNIGKRIRKQRKKQNLTIAELAERANISAVYMGEIERGVGMPSLLTYVEIINALNISSDICLCDIADSGKPHVFNEITEMMRGLSPGQVCYIRDLIKVSIEFLKTHKF